jgi:prepilin-type N-terminal cleavage/methylation domain-containing protein
MLKKLQKRNSEGFTIIEVMIVLAIAALILLIVLLAVPALQRSSRNTQRKNDVSALSSAIGDYINNNNGNGPTTQAQINDSSTGLINNVKLGQYDPAKVFYQGTEATVNGITVSPAGSESASNLSIDDVIVVKGATCNGNNPASGTTRSYILLYAVESKSSTNGQIQCVEAS